MLAATQRLPIRHVPYSMGKGGTGREHAIPAPPFHMLHLHAHVACDCHDNGACRQYPVYQPDSEAVRLRHNIRGPWIKKV